MQIDQKRFLKIRGVILHILGWLTFATISTMTAPGYAERSQQDVIYQIFFTLQIAVFFYINYIILIPKFLAKRKFLLFIILFIILIFGFSCISELSFFKHLTFPNHGTIPMEHGRPPMRFKRFPTSFNPFRGLVIYTIIFIISTGIKMTIEWFKNDKQKRELENDKLFAELSMLKAQINPHFFFNVLNNICSLARSKSEETETYIIKLSQLMRYNLYEQKEDKVLLKKEVQFIEDYIDIQKMRLFNSVEVVFYKTCNLDNYNIEPMLLFPFIENAFKHGISYDVYSKIVIDISVENDILLFSVINTIHKSPDSLSTEKDKGIGLQNVLKRLKLLYPDKHEILIKNNNKEFSILLKLKLL
jgi:two-component system, LytTR family, sensor kinase